MEVKLQDDPRFLKGVEYFNDCEFFEAHDAWEEVWTEYQGPSRDFYKGLIQMAVCLHHFGNGNARGAIKLYHSSSKYLQPYLPLHAGVNLQQVLSQFDICCQQLLVAEEEFPEVEIVPDDIPEIHLEA